MVVFLPSLASSILYSHFSIFHTSWQPYSFSSVLTFRSRIYVRKKPVPLDQYLTFESENIVNYFSLMYIDEIFDLTLSQCIFMLNNFTHLFTYEKTGERMTLQIGLHNFMFKFMYLFSSHYAQCRTR